MNVAKELVGCKRQHVIFIGSNNLCYCYHCVAHIKVAHESIFDLVYSERNIPCNNCGDTILGTVDADYYNNH